MMRSIFAALLAAMLFGAPAASAQETGAPPPAPTSDALFAATLNDLTDTPQALAAFRGKPLLIYFFASWCAPCHKEAPKLVRLYEEYKPKGVAMIGVALDTAEKARAFAEKYGASNLILHGGREVIQLGRDLGNEQGGIPFTVVVGRDGTIVEAIQGDAPDGKLEAALARVAG